MKLASVAEKVVVDRRGRKRVLIPLRKYERLLEELDDLRVIAERRAEHAISFREMAMRLKRRGVLGTAVHQFHLPD